MSTLALTPAPPYYAAIFTSVRSPHDDGYDAMTDAMVELAKRQPGFLGMESARRDIGITVSYWRDAESIHQWKLDVAHQEAQRLGRERWYARYCVRIAKVERDYMEERA